MSRQTVILILAFILVMAVPNAITAQENLLKEGFVLRSVDGQLIGPDRNDVCFFEFSSDVNDYETVIKAGTKLELLPSSGLEKVITDMKTRSAATYRLLDGRITKYKGRNFIFPKYFLPLSKTKEQEPQAPPKSEEDKSPEPKIAISEPNDILTVPPEVLEKLKVSRSEIASRGRPRADSNEFTIERTRNKDSVLVDRTAFLVEGNDGRPIFVLDALGRNMQHTSLKLLPCEVLELTERRQARMTGPVRFRIAGIRTEYKGESYLLLHKATRIYNHGNFGR
jgi:hypothetical protein